jgi:beta-xylosidase
MKIKAPLILLFFFCSNVFAQQTEKWGDQGDGTYANPILPGDYSDIDAIRVDSDYYAISSTFQFSPGVIILHSKDLINWRILGHVTDDLNRISPELNWDRMNRYGRGIWAGAIRHHHGKFWVYFCTPEEGIFMSTATRPEGPWQPLYKIWGISGWDDCCPFWDEDGQGYLVASNFENKYKIHLFKLSEDGMRLDFHSDSVIHQSKGSEANKIYKIQGYYYHFYSEVNSEGRVAMMERSRNIYGPFEIKQLNHVNPAKDKEPNQGSLIQNASGDWWFLTHQGSGDWEGRAVCLLPVFWINGWPVIGYPGADTIGNMVWSAKKPIEGHPFIFPQTNDDFNQDSLSVQWEWNYQPRKEKWSLSERRGFLRLHAFIPAKTNNKKNPYNLFYKAGNTLTQRSMRTPCNEVRIKLDISGMADGQRAGLVHFSATYRSIGIKQKSGIRSLIYEVDGREAKGPTIIDTAIWFKSVWGYDGISRFAYSLDGKKYTLFGPAYQLGWGFYRGDRIGIFSYNQNQEKGYVDVDFFNYDFAGVKSKTSAK